MSALLALLSSVLWGSADYLAGGASRRLPVPAVVGLSQLAALLGLVPVAVLTGELGADRGYLPPALAAGLVGVVALGSFYRALAVGTMGVVAPIASLGVLVPVAIGLARGEQPSALQLVGTAVAVVGVLLASGPELRGRSGALPVVLAGVSAVGFGLTLVLIAAGSRRSVVMTLLTMRLTSVLLMSGLLCAVAPRRGWQLGVSRRDLLLLTAVGAADVGANGSFAVASTSGLVSVTAVLASLFPIVTVLLARRYDGERLRRMQLVGVGAALGGVLLVAGG